MAPVAPLVPTPMPSRSVSITFRSRYVRFSSRPFPVFKTCPGKCSRLDQFFLSSLPCPPNSLPVPSPSRYCLILYTLRIHSIPASFVLPKSFRVVPLFATPFAVSLFVCHLFLVSWYVLLIKCRFPSPCLLFIDLLIYLFIYLFVPLHAIFCHFSVSVTSSS